jgi:hypothetical protein
VLWIDGRHGLFISNLNDARSQAENQYSGEVFISQIPVYISFQVNAWQIELLQK